MEHYYINVVFQSLHRYREYHCDFKSSETAKFHQCMISSEQSIMHTNAKQLCWWWFEDMLYVYELREVIRAFITELLHKTSRKMFSAFYYMYRIYKKDNYFDPVTCYIWLGQV